MDRTNFIKDIVLKAGKLIKAADPTVGVKIKDGKNDLVTATDLASEKLIVNAIKKNFPKDSIMSEETPFGEKDVLSIPHLWVIDPIDGTHNFRYQRNYSAVSIGYVQLGEVILGAVYNPFVNEFYFSEKDSGAFLNKNRIYVSNVDNFMLGTVAFDYCRDHDLTRKTLSYFLKLSPLPVPRLLGAASLSMCGVAAGKHDLYYTLGVSPWDNAAAFLILQEAGAVVVNTKGKPINFLSREVVCGNEILVNKFLAQIN